MSSIGVSPPLVPGSTTVPATVAVAQPTDPSLSFDVGSLIKAVVKDRNSQGQLVVATNRGDVLLTTPLSPPSGTSLILQVRGVQANLLTVIVSVEGRSTAKPGATPVDQIPTLAEKSAHPNISGLRVSGPSVTTAHSVFSGTITGPATSGSPGAVLGPLPDILTQAKTAVSGRQYPVTQNPTTANPTTANPTAPSRTPSPNWAPPHVSGHNSSLQNTAPSTPINQNPIGQTPVGPIPIGQTLAAQTPIGQTPADQTPKSGNPTHASPTRDHPIQGRLASSNRMSTGPTNPASSTATGQAGLTDRSDPAVVGKNTPRSPHGLSPGTASQTTSPTAAGSADAPAVGRATAPGRSALGSPASLAPSHLAGSVSGNPSTHSPPAPPGASPGGNVQTSAEAVVRLSGKSAPSSPNFGHTGNRISDPPIDHLARNPLPQDPLSQKPGLENRGFESRGVENRGLESQGPRNPVSGTPASGDSAVSRNPIASGNPGSPPDSGAAVSKTAGVRLDFRLVALENQGSSPTALLHKTARSLPAGSTLISGVVSSGGDGGTASQTGAATRILTPVGTVSLDGQVALPNKASVVLQLVRALPSDDGIDWLPPSLSLEGVSRGQWPVLKETVSSLFTNGEAPILDRLVSSPGPRLAGLMLLFITALRGGNMKGWLGEEGQNILAQKIGPTTLQRLREDFSRFGQFLAETQPDDWRFFIVPVYDGREDHFMHWRVRHRGKNPNQQDQDETRFVIDLTLSRLGDMQFDGFLKERQFDLVIRSRQPLSNKMQHDIRDLYINAQQITGFNGDILFQITEKFIQPEARKKTAPHSDFRI